MRFSGLHLLCFLLAPVCAAFAADDSIITYWVDEDFEYIRENVHDAIIGRGMKVANELQASDMLNRTAPDLGIDKDVFQQAVTVEFCSALISHRLVRAHPSNMVLCPFTISIYVLSDEPGRVYIAYKPPSAGTESAETLEEIEALLQAIVTESME